MKLTSDLISTTVIKIVFILLTVCFCIGVANGQNHLNTASINQADTSKMNAASLINATSRMLTYTIKEAQKLPGDRLSLQNNEAAPFWHAVKKLNNSIDKMNRGILLKDESFHQGLSEAVSHMEEVKTCYELLGKPGKTVADGIQRTSKAVELLYKNYAFESQNQEQELSEQELNQLDSIKLQQKDFQKKLTEMEKKLGKNAKGLKELKQRSKELERARNNRHDYLWAMHHYQMMHGCMWGYHWHWGHWGGWCVNYPIVIITFNEDYTDLYDAYDWGYLDASIYVYDDFSYEYSEQESLETESLLNNFEFSQEDYFQHYEELQIQPMNDFHDQMPEQEIMFDTYDSFDSYDSFDGFYDY